MIHQGKKIAMILVLWFLAAFILASIPTASGHCETLKFTRPTCHRPQTSSLIFSTYLGGSVPCVSGGSAFTFAQNCTCDAQGNTYVTGATTVSDLPVLNPWQGSPAPGSTQSAFVAKYDPNGQPLWCTYLGGNNQSMGIGVAAMPNGGVVVVGLTTSDNFPTMNACQGQYNGSSDYFVTVYDANGIMKYSTYLGGSGVEGQLANQSTPYADDQNNGNCVAVDAQGLVYVAGMTNSGGSGTKKFPVTPNAYQGEIGGGLYDACLCIIDPSQSGRTSLIYASFLGGAGDDQGHSVAVNPSGSLITVAGYTTSTHFPTTPNALAQTPASGFTSNGFVTQFQSTQPGSPTSTYNMLYSTYLGGSYRDDTYGMTMDPTGLIVATGRTESFDFPMTAGGPTIFNNRPPGSSNDEPYVVKINPTLSGKNSLVYSTFLGGQGGFCTSVGVDARGSVYVAGESDALGQIYDPSNQTSPSTFPYTPNALFTALQGSYDAILMQIEPGGANLGYSTYLGGTDSDRAYGLAVDPARNIVLTGLTFSPNFPLQNPAQTYPGNSGYQNAFVTKFSPLTGGRPTHRGGTCPEEKEIHPGANSHHLRDLNGFGSRGD
jgi:hypothetical protein